MEAKLRNQGFGSEILKHYLSNIVDKKRVGVWTDFDSKAIKTYERAGFKKENLKSYVYIGGEVNNDRKIKEIIEDITGEKVDENTDLIEEGF